MASKRLRFPKLCYSPKRGLGYHVNYRDPVTGSAKKHKFGMISEGEALAQYHRWVADRLNWDAPAAASPPPPKPVKPSQPSRANQIAKAVSQSLPVAFCAKKNLASGTALARRREA